MTDDLRDLLEHLVDGLLVISGPDRPLNTEYGKALFDKAITAGVFTEKTLIDGGVSPDMARYATNHDGQTSEQ